MNSKNTKTYIRSSNKTILWDEFSTYEKLLLFHVGINQVDPCYKYRSVKLCYKKTYSSKNDLKLLI